MNEIPSLKEWLTVTNGGMLSVRSKQLKLLDTALEDYWKTPGPLKLKPLRDALANWISKEGPDWRTSRRNAAPKRIVEQLYAALDTNSFSDEDRKAFAWQDEQRRTRLAFLFAGAKFVTRGDYYNNSGRSGWDILVRHTGELTKAGLSKVGDPAAKAAAGVGIQVAVAEMLKAMGDTSDLEEVSKLLLEACGVSAAEVIKTLAECLPLISLGASGIQMLHSAGQAARAAKRASEIGRRSGFILPGGDMVKAFEALHQFLQRERNNQARIAAIDAGTFGARVAFHATDGGVVSSAALTASSIVAKLLNWLRNAIRAAQETKAANLALRDRNNLDSKIFRVFPLLGCYMLLRCDTFEIVNMVRTEQERNGAVRFGSLAFKEQIEWIKRKHLDPVLAAAADCVSKSPFLLLDANNRALYLEGTRFRFEEVDGKIRQYKVPKDQWAPRGARE